jgi:small subunit ribosomal protein S9
METYTWGTGRRKTSVARVRLKKGKGDILVNGEEVAKYFTQRHIDLDKIYQPFKVTDTLNQYDVFVNVHGGGTTGQSVAISLGIARALVILNLKNKAFLKQNGLLTRDSRMVERKKYGLKKARKSEQFSKR